LSNCAAAHLAAWHALIVHLGQRRDNVLLGTPHRHTKKQQQHNNYLDLIAALAAYYYPFGALVA
jgi:hypothetical protein